MSHKHIVITVPGIRTYGDWQHQLERLTKQADPSIEFHHYKNSWFSFAEFLPPFRWIELRYFTRELRDVFYRYPGCQPSFDLVGHSFGTYLIAKALSRLKDDNIVKANTVILAGSTLSSRFNWLDLFYYGKVQRIFNYCSCGDWVLIFYNMFLTFYTDVSGRGGFKWMTSPETRVNCFCKGGHSSYFKTRGLPSDCLIRDHWVPRLTSVGLPCPTEHPYPTSTPIRDWLFRKISWVRILLILILFVYNTYPLFVKMLAAFEAQRKLANMVGIAESYRDSLIHQQSRLNYLTDDNNVLYKSNKEHERDLRRAQALLDSQITVARYNYNVAISQDSLLHYYDSLLYKSDNIYIPLQLTTSALHLRDNKYGLALLLAAKASTYDRLPLADSVLLELLAYNPMIERFFQPYAAGPEMACLEHDASHNMLISADFLGRFYSWDGLCDYEHISTIRYPYAYSPYSLALSSDGRTMAYCSLIFSCVVRNLATGAALVSIKWPHDEYELRGACLAFSLDGVFIATGSSDGVIRVVRTSDTTSRFEINTPSKSPVIGIRFITKKLIIDRALLIAETAAGALLLYDIANTQSSLINSIIPHTTSEATCFAVSSNDSILATGANDGSIQIRNVISLSLDHEMHVPGGYPTCVTFHHNDKSIAFGSSDGNVYIYQLPPASAPIVALHGHEDRVTNIESLDSCRLASAGKDNMVILWNSCNTWPSSCAIPGIQATARHPVIAQLDTLLAYCFSPSEVHLINLRACGHGLGVLKWPESIVEGLCFSDSGHTLGATNTMGDYSIWDVTTQDLLYYGYNAHASKIATLAYSVASKRAITLGGDGRLKCWSLCPIVSPQGNRSVRPQRITCFAFCAENSLMAFGTEVGSVALIDTTIGCSGVIHCNVSDAAIVGVALSGNNATIIAIDALKRVYTYNYSTNSGHLVAQLPTSDSMTTICVSPDGGRCIIYGNSTKAFVLDNIRLAGLQITELAHPSPVTTASFMSTLGNIITGAVDGSYFVWDARTLSLDWRGRHPSGMRITALTPIVGCSAFVSADSAGYILLNRYVGSNTYVSQTLGRSGIIPGLVNITADGRIIGICDDSCRIELYRVGDNAIMLGAKRLSARGVAVSLNIEGDENSYHWFVQIIQLDRMLMLIQAAGIVGEYEEIMGMGDLRCVALSDDGRRIAAGTGRGRIVDYDIESHTVRNAIALASQEAITAVQYSRIKDAIDIRQGISEGGRWTIGDSIFIRQEFINGKAKYNNWDSGGQILQSVVLCHNRLIANYADRRVMICNCEKEGGIMEIDIPVDDKYYGLYVDEAGDYVYSYGKGGKIWIRDYSKEAIQKRAKHIVNRELRRDEMLRYSMPSRR